MFFILYFKMIGKKIGKFNFKSTVVKVGKCENIYLFVDSRLILLARGMVSTDDLRLIEFFFSFD